jgi:hypothetical protein
MSGTPTMVKRIMDRLTADGTLTGLLPGGIYNQPIIRESDAGGATPNAFAPTPPYQPRPAAVVTDGTDEQVAFGPDGAFTSFPRIYLYAPTTQNGKDTIANAFDTLFSLLHGWRFATGNGTGAEVRVISRLETMDDPETSGRLVGGLRLQVTGLWRHTGA